MLNNIVMIQDSKLLWLMQFLNATILNVINISLMSILVLVWSPNLQLN